MGDRDLVELAVSNRVATLTLNNPDERNTMNASKRTTASVRSS
jgi:enoyl-CoA hydratase/carnithine racemase